MRSLNRQCGWLFAATLLSPASAVNAQKASQKASQHALHASVHGTVRIADGQPVAGANVFLLETLDGMITAADGRFSIPAPDTTRVTLVVRQLGFLPVRQIITRAERDSEVVVVLNAAPHALNAVTVQAGRYSADNERGATLTSLDVVTTPGAAADVNRAIQTLPGVQQVDEGTGLFVRGGDYTETKTFLDDAVVLNPTDIQSPSGTFTGTVDPFLLDGIVFSSGGFGARYGNALSGVVSLHTQGQPAKQSLTASAGLAALSASIAEPLPHGVGLRAATNLFDLRPLIRVNGSSQRYSPPPKGHDLSGSVIWKSPRTGELTIFGIEQTSRVGVGVDDPSYSGTYAASNRSDFVVATWHAAYGRFIPTVSASTAHTDRVEGFGVLDLATRLRQQQLFAQGEWAGVDWLTLRGGAEIERTHAEFDGSIPARSADVAPGARVNVLRSDTSGVRSALFGESDFLIGGRTRVVVGLRTDSSTLTHRRTLDPRLSVAMRPTHALSALPELTLTAAWGVYHEVPDPLLFDPTLGETALRSMRAVHTILGVQLGDGASIARIEVYDKRYVDLAQQNRDYATVAGGTGFARGVDLFLKGNGPLGTTGRLTYSYLTSRRTDPNSGVIADAPFDIPQTLTVVLERALPYRIQLGGAYRYATGRPVTPVVGAVRDSTGYRWIPSYGAPLSERLPHFARVDLSVSQLRAISPNWLVVLYASVNNVLGRSNIYDYTYSADYRTRTAVGSLFNRSLYFGATLIH